MGVLQGWDLSHEIGQMFHFALLLRMGINISIIFTIPTINCCLFVKDSLDLTVLFVKCY